MDKLDTIQHYIDNDKPTTDQYKKSLKIVIDKLEDFNEMKLRGQVKTNLRSMIYQIENELKG